MSEDLIKRSDAIGAISNHCENECYYRVDNWCPQCQIEEFQKAIKAIPSADRPSGEWLKFGLGRGTRILFCTNCEKRIEVPLSQGDLNYDFCPNCGAKMKGEDDETD